MTGFHSLKKREKEVGAFSLWESAAGYNVGVKRFFKSLAFGLLGAALFFAFFSMLAIPLLAAWSRLHNANTPLQAADVVIRPIAFLRLVGLPLALAAFVTCFVLGWRKFMRAEHSS